MHRKLENNKNKRRKTKQSPRISRITRKKIDSKKKISFIYTFLSSKIREIRGKKYNCILYYNNFIMRLPCCESCKSCQKKKGKKDMINIIKDIHVSAAKE
jgi:hypothetical protein